MKSAKLWLVVFTASLLLAGISCSKKESSSPAAPASNNPPQLDVEEVTLPQAMTNSSDTKAQEAAGYVNTANSFTQYMQFLSPSSSAGALRAESSYQGPPWNYTWTVDDGQDNNYTVDLTIDENDTLYTWKVIVSGTIDGAAINNFMLISARQGKDDSSGYLIMYDPSTAAMSVRIDWYRSGGDYVLQYQMFNNSRVVVNSYHDGTGRVSYYEWNGSSYPLRFQATWNADGSGEWWTYNSSGVNDGSGSWSI